MKIVCHGGWGGCGKEGNKINTLTFKWEEQKKLFYDKSYICFTFPSAMLKDKTSRQKEKHKLKIMKK